MAGGIKELAAYRLERATEMLIASEENIPTKKAQQSCPCCILPSGNLLPHFHSNGGDSYPLLEQN